jgi:monoamine oxidase
MPALPDWKRRALNSIKMTSYVKVFVAWESKWWKNENPKGQTYTLLLDDGEEGKRWRMFN